MFRLRGMIKAQGSIKKTDSVTQPLLSPSSSTATSPPNITPTTSSTTATSNAPTAAAAATASATARAKPFGNTTMDRQRAEQVRKNWKVVLDVALKKKNELVENEVNMNFGGNNGRHSFDNTREIYATDKENWIFFSIIISIVIIFSVIFCFVVYWFFPQFRAKAY